jgi:multidrug efflux pump subunit AcrB
MDKKSNILDKFKDFTLSTLAVKNRKTVYLILAMILIGGAAAYQSMPRESFPEVQIPQIYVNVPYPGNSPEIITDKIIKPLEKELNKLKGIEKIKSTATQDFGILDIKFKSSVTPDDAKDLVEEALNDARSDKSFAQDLPVEPTVAKFDVSDMPIVNINLSGNYPVQYLKDRAELLKDKIEGLSEVNSADIRGVQDQKLKIEMRKYDAEAKGISFRDIEQAIKNDNLTVGAGNLSIDGIDHFVKIEGKFKTEEEILNLVVKHEGVNDVYLYEVADVSFGDVDISSYARQNGNSVVMLDIKKRAGENIISAIDKIKIIVNQAKLNGQLPENLDVTYTNDQSSKIRSQVSNLENSIIFGMLLVIGVLLFFLGLRNALFVGIAIPLSMFMSMVFLNMFGVTLNIMVLFSLVLALGMLVDNGIVVVENVYRLMDEEGMNGIKAAIYGVGEVAWPIIASTATTLAVFIPLALWPGTMGQFMQYLPITLMVVLGSSLFVALIINPVLTAVLMKLEEAKQTYNFKSAVFLLIGLVLGFGFSLLETVTGSGFAKFLAVLILGSVVILAPLKYMFYAKETETKYALIPGLLLIVFSILFYVFISILTGNILFTLGLLILLNKFYFIPVTDWFQNKILPKIENGYQSVLDYTMKGKRSLWIFIGTFGLLFFSFFLVGAFPPKILFFPDNEPNYFNVFIEHPAGTDINVTNQTTKEVKQVVDAVLNKKHHGKIGGKTKDYTYGSAYKVVNIKDVKNHIVKDTVYFVESIIEQVGKGTSDNKMGPAFGETPHKAKITVAFCEFKNRQGLSPAKVMKEVQDTLKNWGYADVKIIVDKEKNGPPQEPPVNIEVTGSENYKEIIIGAELIKKYLTDKNVSGVQELTSSVELNKAEINIDLNRAFLRANGMSTGQIASTIRTALFGNDISTFEVDDDIYDINLRLGKQFRGGIDDLLDQKIIFMNNRGQKMNIPIRSVVNDVEINYTNSSIKRTNQINLVTVYSDVEQGANANEVVDKLKGEMEGFSNSPEGQKFEQMGLNYKFSGQMDEQAKEMAFLSKALLIAVFLILFIIIAQFNSFSTPAIILISVILSLVGVFLGIVISRDNFVIMMTMIGIISLAGIVVNNVIVLIDYTNLLRKRRREELGLTETELLPIEDIKSAIIQGGKTRLRPVLLTAITTILGLIPLATGMNIDFFSLYTDLDPQIFFGGDNAIFFGPMSWTIIYGLTFSTFLTLVVVPAMYYLLYRFKLYIYKKMNWELKIDIK